MGELLNHHRAALTFAGKLLSHNSKTTAVYINFPEERDWRQALFNVFVGPNSNRLTRVLDGVATERGIRLVDASSTALASRRSEDSFQREFGLEEIHDDLVCDAANHLGLHNKQTFDADVRFSVWGVMLAACASVLPKIPGGRADWHLRTVSHGGWGTYYLEFCRSHIGEVFRLSEEGYIGFSSSYNAIGDEWSANARSIGDGMNLRQLVRSGVNQSSINNLLAWAIKAMHARAPITDMRELPSVETFALGADTRSGGVYAVREMFPSRHIALPRLDDVRAARLRIGIRAFGRDLFKTLNLSELLGSIDELRQSWCVTHRRQQLLEKLSARGYDSKIQALQSGSELTEAPFKDFDTLDVLAMFVFAKPMIPRTTRAMLVELRMASSINLSSQRGKERLQFVRSLLADYCDVGMAIFDRDLTDLLVEKYGSTDGVQRILGGVSDGLWGVTQRLLCGVNTSIHPNAIECDDVVPRLPPIPTDCFLDGEVERATELIEYCLTEIKLLAILDSEHDLIALWSDHLTRADLLRELEGAGCCIDDIKSLQSILKTPNCDIFDVLALIAYGKPPMSRSARARKARFKMAELLTERQEEFVDLVLENYVATGVEMLDDSGLIEICESKFGGIAEAARHMGGVAIIRDTFAEVQKFLYQDEAA